LSKGDSLLTAEREKETERESMHARASSHS